MQRRLIRPDWDYRVLIACLSFCRSATTVRWKHSVPDWICPGNPDHPIHHDHRIPLEYEPRAPEYLPKLDLRLLDSSTTAPSTPLSEHQKSVAAENILHTLRTMYADKTLTNSHVALIRQTMTVFYAYITAMTRVTLLRRHIYGNDKNCDKPVIFGSSKNREYSAHLHLREDRPELDLAKQFQRFASDTAYRNHYFASAVRTGRPLMASFFDDSD